MGCIRGTVDQLFLTNTKPHKAASLNTISNWVKYIFKGAGIRTELATAGSMRVASTSKALAVGAPLDIILNSAGWSRSSTFTRFYRKDLLSDMNMGSFVLQ